MRRKIISILIFMAFGIVTIYPDAFAADAKNPTPSVKTLTETGVSAAKFDALSQKQAEAVAFKNALAVSQVQPHAALNQVTPAQNTYPDGKVIQTIDGIDFVKVEQRQVIRKEPSRNKKLKALLRGRKAYATYVEVVTSRIVGRTQDGSAISNITLDNNGRVSGYARTRQQNLTNILFDLEEDVSNITYDANGKVLSRLEWASLKYKAPSGVMVLNIKTDPSFRVKGYDIFTSQNINGIHFAVSQDVSVAYNQRGQAYGTITNVQISGAANDGRAISGISLNNNNLISGYTEKRSQALAGIQFDLERQVSGINYDVNGNRLNQNEWASLKYSAKKGVEVSDIKVDSFLRVQGYKVKQTNKAINKQIPNGPDEAQTFYEISDIAYDSNNKISSLTLASFRSFEITYVGGGYAYYREQVIRGVAPNKLSGIQAEIYAQVGIPVVYIAGQFSQDQLLAIQRVLNYMYPTHLLDEVSIIQGQPGERQNVGGAILVNTGGWANPAGVVRIFGTEVMDATTIEDILVHELAHVIHFKETDTFKTNLRDEFARLHDASGSSPADTLNYNDTIKDTVKDPNGIKRDPSLVPAHPAYGMTNMFEDFATMMQGWFWNSMSLLARGIQQFTQLAKEILLKKALILAEVFSHTIDGIEYTYTLKGSALGDFVRACSRIIRDAAGKITKIGDILIPN